MRFNEVTAMSLVAVFLGHGVIMLFVYSAAVNS